MRSFRTQTFAIAMIIATLMLLTVVLIGRWQLIQYERARIETRMCMEIKRLTKGAISSEDKLRIWNDMSQKLHLESPLSLAFKVNQIDELGNLHISSTRNWPERFSPEPALTTSNEVLMAKQSKKCQIEKAMISDTRWIHASLYSKSQAASIIVNEDDALVAIHRAINSAITYLIPLYIFISAVASFLLTKLVTRPVLRLSTVMQSVDKNGLHSRLDSNAEYEEFGEFIRSYNDMLERLEKGFRQASLFSANAAHELRTPLTILQGKLEQSINRQPLELTPAELSSMLDEVTRLANITKKLLLLTQAENGELYLTKSDFNISAMLNDLVGDMEMLPHAKTVRKNFEDSATIFADELLVRQLLVNLLSNALKYAIEASTIEIDLWTEKSNCVITFKNTCDYISLQERNRFFDYFYRGDPARNRHIEGTGLGLNVALEIAKAHKGNLYLEDTDLNVIKFVLCLPLRS